MLGKKEIRERKGGFIPAFLITDISRNLGRIYAP